MCCPLTHYIIHLHTVVPCRAPGEVLAVWYDAIQGSAVLRTSWLWQDTAGQGHRQRMPGQLHLHQGQLVYMSYTTLETPDNVHVHVHVHINVQCTCTLYMYVVVCTTLSKSNIVHTLFPDCCSIHLSSTIYACTKHIYLYT